MYEAFLCLNHPGLTDIPAPAGSQEVVATRTRHGPKPGRHEAEAFSMLEAEAEALTHFSLEAEALVTKPKPKPGYLYSTNVS